MLGRNESMLGRHKAASKGFSVRGSKQKVPLIAASGSSNRVALNVVTSTLANVFTALLHTLCNNLKFGILPESQ